jgi:hypothetical protein
MVSWAGLAAFFAFAGICLNLAEASIRGVAVGDTGVIRIGFCIWGGVEAGRYRFQGGRSPWA